MFAYILCPAFWLHFGHEIHTIGGVGAQTNAFIITYACMFGFCVTSCDQIGQKSFSHFFLDEFSSVSVMWGP